jgi:hypothetical protein
VGVAHEAEVAVGQNADRLAFADDWDPGDAVARHHLEGLVDPLLRLHRDRIDDHAGLGALDLADLGRLGADREVLVQHADAAVLRHADGGLVLGDGVHRRRDQGDVEGDLSRELRSEIDVGRKDVAGAGHEEDVVERQSLANPAIAHFRFVPSPSCGPAPRGPWDGRAV